MACFDKFRVLAELRNVLCNIPFIHPQPIGSVIVSNLDSRSVSTAHCAPRVKFNEFEFRIHAITPPFFAPVFAGGNKSLTGRNSPHSSSSRTSQAELPGRPEGHPVRPAVQERQHPVRIQFQAGRQSVGT